MFLSRRFSWLSTAPVKDAASSCAQAAFLAICHSMSMDLSTEKGSNLIFLHFPFEKKIKMARVFFISL